MLNREIILEALRENYSRELIQIIKDCQFVGKRFIDTSSLNKGLNSLDLAHGELELSTDDWSELIYELVPDTYDELTYLGLVG